MNVDDFGPISYILLAAGFVSSYFFWDACLNYKGRKRLLDQYYVAGVETTAKVIRRHLTIHKRNFSETHRTLLVHFAYNVPGSEEHVVVKHYSRRLERGTRPAATPSLLVKVLPGYPKSGLPIFEIEDREWNYGPTTASTTAGFTLCIMIAGAFNQLVDPRLSLLAFALVGLPLALLSSRSWENARLRKCDQEMTLDSPRDAEEPLASAATFAEASLVPNATSTTTFVEASVVSGGGDSPVPIATAVPVDVEAAQGAVEIPLLPDGLAEAIWSEAKRCSFHTLVSKLDEFRHGNWDARTAYVELAASHWADKAPHRLDACPDTAVGNLFHGVHHICRAWDARTSATADRVPESAWPLFHSSLLIAKEHLLRAAAQDPEDPTPHSFLAGPVAMGLQLGREQTSEWFANAIDNDPLNYKAHFGHLATLCKKWGGSHEAMFAFARRTTESCPDSARLRGILLQAFYERWIFIDKIDRRHRVAKDYLRSPKVRDETIAIYKRCFERKEICCLSEVGPHASATRFLLVAGFEDEAVRELKKLQPWTKVLQKNDIVAGALRLPCPEVVAQLFARKLRS